MKGVPSFKDKNGNAIYKERYVSALIHTMYAGKDICHIENETIHILTSVKTEDAWEVTVSFDYT